MDAKLRKQLHINKLQHKAEPIHRLAYMETERIIEKNGWASEWIRVLDLICRLDAMDDLADFFKSGRII